jgi:serine phosphatase RsbU (regulator of sigma subunit)/anti-sigma regulatory factor (Ser/Thr protein kinase)
MHLAAAQDSFRRGEPLLSLDEALLRTLDASEQIESILDFFVPEYAEGAQIQVNTGGASARAAAKGKLDGLPVRIKLETPQRRMGYVELYLPSARLSSEAAVITTALRHCAMALSNSVAYFREKRAALTFQNGALAAELPQTAAYSFEAVYQSGRADELVGGDWYDAFTLPDGRCIISIGDVLGSGVEAAVEMVNVRQAIRSAAHIHTDPLVMIACADRTVREQHPGRFVTAFVAVLDPVTNECAYASAGHPPPFLRDPNGRITALQSGGVPLGVALPGTVTWSRSLVSIEANSVLLLYTDGLTEATRDVLVGEARVRAALEALDPHQGDVAQRVYDSVLSGHSNDDVAILAVRFHRTSTVRRWRFDPRWSDATRRVRDEVRKEVLSAGFGDTFALDTVFAEVCANLIRYAPGIADLYVEHRDESVVLHVLDKGPGFYFAPCLPSDLFSDGGRGLFLIRTLAKTFTVIPRPGAGSHARIEFQRESATITTEREEKHNA